MTSIDLLVSAWIFRCNDVLAALFKKSSDQAFVVGGESG